MDVVILLFDRFTALDAVGPYEVLRNLPGAKVTRVPRPDRKKKKELPAPDGPGPAPKVLNPRK